MNYGQVMLCDTANGYGMRISLFVSGCSHHCKNCFNEETWDFNYGEKFTDEVKEWIFSHLKDGGYQGITILGGEPMEIPNQKGLVDFVEEYKNKFPEKDLWIYTGYLFEDLLDNGKMRVDNVTDRILKCTDIIVDGEFKEELKNIRLEYKGSSNQRIIDVQKSLKENKIILYM